mmetsp:Transcript_30762/g.55319  ORF Transcript_30762/g.55319 Transcript_30762/m.55319 type:complete len:93 (+) Transcript_30762:271-549(+)
MSEKAVLGDIQAQKPNAKQRATNPAPYAVWTGAVEMTVVADTTQGREKRDQELQTRFEHLVSSGTTKGSSQSKSPQLRGCQHWRPPGRSPTL